ncbi:NADP-dependent oxidoreductase [Leifsonia shinshuensis]|uniref:NADP-dependent oxidoreductase n=1 Tax=Leifsonia shinshuensis TaxID=150026 RepID=A0A7G6YA05_9MICO|nr:NADP-dependent oxidoreductase [Leifsonia shinshuensis]QNE35320.1 NADP-dependent oxidoreductase [Leifsonia shinshuensis]
MPNTMRAALLDAAGDPAALRIGEAPTPDRVNAEFLVKVVAAGVNPLDASTRSGSGAFGAIHSFPAVLGQDFSGVVVESPFAAHPLRPGDEVFGMVMVPRFGGSYAEYVSVPSMSLVRKPATLSHIEAAAAPHAALTAWGMVVELAKAHDGQRLLVHAGTGAVGHFAIQFAAYFGAHVIATTPNANHAWLRALGAAEVVDEAATGYDPTGLGDTVDVVIDPSSDLERATRALALIRPGGLLVLHVPAGVDPGLAEAASAAGVRATGYTGAPDGSTLAVIARLLETGSVRVHVDRIFPLDEIADAHRALEHEQTRGAIVLKVAEG